MSNLAHAGARIGSPAREPAIDVDLFGPVLNKPKPTFNKQNRTEVLRFPVPKKVSFQSRKTRRDELYHVSLPNGEASDNAKPRSRRSVKGTAPELPEQTGPSKTGSTNKKRFINKRKSPVDVTCNSCFVCFEQGGRDYAVKVDVAWPYRQEWRCVVSKKVRTFGERNVDQGTHVEVMQAMQDAVYRHVGSWKRWLWCYEMRAAEEVKFYFDDLALRDKASIVVVRLDPLAIERAAANTVLAGNDGDCDGGPHHTRDCLDGQDIGYMCAQDELHKARIRLHGLRMRHWLLECLQKPDRAQQKKFLAGGLLQDGFVYTSEEKVKLPTDADELASGKEFRGVYVSFGWNLGRMLRNMRTGSTCAVFGLSLAWLTSLLWAGNRGDWSTAFALGQLIAVSVALILQQT